MIYIYLVKILALLILVRVLFHFLIKVIKKKTQIDFPYNDNMLRQNLFKLAVADLLHLPLGLLLFAVFFGLTWYGFLTPPILQQINAGEGPAFISLFAGTDIYSLLFCFVFGVVCNLLFFGFGFSVSVATTLIFPFFISTPGAALLIFGDMFGSWLRTFRNHNVQGFLLRFIGVALALVVFWVFGGYWRELLNSFQFNPFNPGERSIQVMTLVALLVGVDTLISMIAMHFYFQLIISRKSRP
jgi:hypothetical protein